MLAGFFGIKEPKDFEFSAADISEIGAFVTVKHRPRQVHIKELLAEEQKKID